MPKVQPIYDTRERARAPRESAPIQNERPRGAAGILGEEEQCMLRRPTRSPPTPYYLPCRRICQAQSGANEPPHHKRVRTDSAKVLLDLREDARGLAQTGGRLTSSHPCRCGGSSQGPREGSRAQGAPRTHTSGSSEQAFSHPKDDSAPRFSTLGPKRRAPAKGGATMSRKPRYASFAPALGPGEQVKSSSTCTSTPPFAVIGAPIAAKQLSTHAFNSSNCSPSLM